jgi:hypothetical protein
VVDTSATVDFGPFDITKFVVQGQNTIVFMDPTSLHFGVVRDVSIRRATQYYWHVSQAKEAYPGHSVTYPFSVPSLVLTASQYQPSASSSISTSR